MEGVMSALSAIESPALGVSDATGEVSAAATSTDTRSRMPRLAVVTPTGRARAGRPVRAGGAGKPRSSSIASSRPGAAPPVVVRGTVRTRAQASGSRTPVRLTRRGRAVVACILVTGLTIGALLISLLVSGGAQATNHGQARAGYQGMRQVVVRPGGGRSGDRDGQRADQRRHQRWAAAMGSALRREPGASLRRAPHARQV